MVLLLLLIARAFCHSVGEITGIFGQGRDRGGGGGGGVPELQPLQYQLLGLLIFSLLLLFYLLLISSALAAWVTMRPTRIQILRIQLPSLLLVQF